MYLGINFMSWILCIYLLLILCSYGGQARELAGTKNKFLEIPVEDSDVRKLDTGHTHDHFTTHTDHIDPSLMVFFTLKDLKVGKRMPIHFPKRDPANSPKLWSREEADSVPFSSNQLPYLLKLFSFSPDSSQAIAMENTLRECESKPIKGEVKFCATSLESMLDFTQSILGVTSDLQVFATLHQTKSSVTFQNYTILDTLMEIPAPKMVACHTIPYPYAVFYCHSQESGNKVYRVSLAGENEDRVEAMVVCHLDTSQWAPSHVSFQVLKITPGSSPVCHFFPADHLIWVPKLQAHGSSSM
ncbi:BURP domain-containing protein 3 [Spatholobus suberectus]|nr:BURP domain-containing protein 3 [Spatholobus suberectus]